MNPEQAALYQRVREFRFDPDGATHTFAQRLAKENGWSPQFAERVIGEYRRFAFLAAAAGHPVSPSDAVDQAWHLHLVYTRSYWDEFCGKVLRKPLHHEPGTGVRGERAKFDDWYARTLQSYQRFFSQDPPADIWPAPGAKGKHLEEYRRVNVARHWVVPRPLRGVGALGWVLAAFVAGVVAIGGARGASGVTLAAADIPEPLASSLNPFDLSGPAFLALYGAAFVAACCAAWYARSAARGRPEAPPRGLQLDPYQVAYLNGGAVHAVNAAIASLCHRGVLRVHQADATVSVLLPEARIAHPLEQSVLLAAGGSWSRREVRDLREAARGTVGKIGDGLKQLRLVANDAEARAAVAAGLAVALFVPAMGVVKILVGLSRDKPVTFLVLACVVSVVIALAAFARRPLRTRRGDAVLESLRSGNVRLRGDTKRPSAEAFALGVALFGLGYLGGTDLAFLEKSLVPKNTTTASGGCGGSSCGGGCGGGCGGCGGD
jgi:uncharacterized protein (TIGR04222 family)